MNINKLLDVVNFIVALDSDTKVMGLLRPLSASTINVNMNNLAGEFVTGQTTSKLSYIKKSFAKGESIINNVITIRGTNIKAMITADDIGLSKYTMYLDAASGSQKIQDYCFSVTKGIEILMPIGSAIYQSQEEDRFVLVGVDGNIIDDEVMKTGLELQSHISGPVYISQTGNLPTISDYCFSVTKGIEILMPIGSAIYEGQDEGFVLVAADNTVIDYEVLKDGIGEWSHRTGPIYLSKTGSPLGIDDGYIFPSIEYTDQNGITTYRFKPLKETGYPENIAYYLPYWGIIDEPILDSNLFINRGINNIFESVKRLKTVENIQELEKTGFGFFKLYSKGLN